MRHSPIEFRCTLTFFKVEVPARMHSLLLVSTGAHFWTLSKASLRTLGAAETSNHSKRCPHSAQLFSMAPPHWSHNLHSHTGHTTCTVTLVTHPAVTLVTQPAVTQPAVTHPAVTLPAVTLVTQAAEHKRNGPSCRVHGVKLHPSHKLWMMMNFNRTNSHGHHGSKRCQQA